MSLYFMYLQCIRVAYKKTFSEAKANGVSAVERSSSCDSMPI